MVSISTGGMVLLGSSIVGSSIVGSSSTLRCRAIMCKMNRLVVMSTIPVIVTLQSNRISVASKFEASFASLGRDFPGLE